jgi:hypothetical protein
MATTEIFVQPREKLRPGQRMPVTEPMLAHARERKDYIVEKLKAGYPIGRVAVNLKVPVGAVELVGREEGVLPPASSPPAPRPAPVAPPAASTGPSPSNATPTPVQEPPRVAAPSPAPAAAPTPPPAAPTITVPGAAPPAPPPQEIQPIPSAVTQPPVYTQPPILPPASAYEAPGAGLIDACRRCLLFAGVRPTQAEGILQAYQTTSMDDVKELVRIMKTAGCKPTEINFAAELWSREISTGQSGASALDEPASPADALKAKYLQQSPQGGADPAYQALLDKDKMLERRSIELAIRQRELEVQRLEQEMAAKSPNPTGGAMGEDDVVTIPLDFGGFPVMKRIKASEIGAWSPWIKKAPQDAAIDPRIVALEAELKSERAAREAAQKAAEDAWRRDVTEKIAALSAAPRGPDSRDAKIEALQAEMQKDRESRLMSANESIQRELRETRETLGRVQSPDFAASVLQAQREAARKVGMIDRTEAAALSEDQIRLDAEKRAVVRKDEAQGDLLKIGTEAIRDRPKIAKELVDAGAPKMIMDRASKLFAVPGEAVAQPDQPTPEELAAAAANLEVASVEQLPPQEGKPPGRTVFQGR